MLFSSFSLPFLRSSAWFARAALLLWGLSGAALAQEPASAAPLTAKPKTTEAKVEKPSAVVHAGSQLMSCQACSAARHSAGLLGWSAACSLRRQ